MATRQLVLAPTAKADLKKIYQYGLRQWGQNHSNDYLKTMKDAFWSLVKQPLMGTHRPEILPGIRSIPVERHIMFYRVTTDRIEIIRILHGRQDSVRHLK